MTRSRRARRGSASAVVGVMLVVGHGAVAAQVDGSEDLDFERPEAWAQKYFAAVTQFGGFGAPRPVAVGAVEVGLEGGWVPSLSLAERTVGFNGVKEEDLNKTEIFGRLRLRLGLPGALSLSLAYTPPIDIDGAKAYLFGVSVARPLVSGRRARLGLRLHGQIGEVRGDFTCPRDVVNAGLDPVANPFLCEEPSKDEFHPRYVGLEVAGGFPLRGGRIEPYAALSANRLDTEFRIRALYSGLDDRTVLSTRGWTWSATAGTEVELGANWRAAGEWFYAPLDVVRPPATSPRNDGLLNVRLMLRWRVR